MFDLFDKMVLPVLTYGAEIWGIHSFKCIENVHIKFCKYLLGVSPNTVNAATLGECGRYPISIICHIRCIKYWLKLCYMSESRFPKACYLKLRALDEVGKTTWATHVRTFLSRYGFAHVWNEQGVANYRLFMLEFKKRLLDCGLQEWHESINSSSKLDAYSCFKSDLVCEKYVLCIYF